MHRTTVNPWTWQDQLGYAQGVLVREPHETLYLAGQCSVDADGAPVHAGDMAAQVNQCLDNLETVLGKAGMSLADVVRLDVYTTDTVAYFGSMPVVNARFAATGTVPAGGILCQVAGLAMPPLMVELVATASR